MTPTSPPSYNFLEEPSNVISNIIRSSPIATDAYHPSPTSTLVDMPQPTTNTDASQPNNNEPNNTKPATPPTPTISNSQPQPTQNVNLNPVLVHPMYLADDTLSRYKALFIANGSTQLEGVDVDETFSLVVKPGTIQTVLSLATSRHWHVHHIDVKNAFLNDDLSETSSKRQPTLSRSSAETEYRGVANAVAETCWLRNLLRELHTLLSPATLVYCDNVNAVYLSVNPVQHQRTKHIEIDIHFVRDLVVAGQVRVLYVLSCYQYADIFIKGLPSALFEEFRTSLSVRCPPAQTAEEC
ncbi:ribonuclease H-like domain-containing protein [Tanacetum coccineum]